MKRLLIVILMCTFAFTGSKTRAADQLSLSLTEAIKIAVTESNNAKIQLVNEMKIEANARLYLSRSELLPHVSATASQSRQTRNLRAMGLGSIPGFVPPKLIGPFSTFDARGEVIQQIFNLSSIRNYKASKVNVEMISVESERTKDEVAAETARSYLDALASRITLDSANANVKLAEDLLSLAQQQKKAGTGTRIEVTRAEVQLADRTQWVLSAESQLRQSKIKLLRVIGIDMSVDLNLTERWMEASTELGTLEQMIANAQIHRSDLQSQQQREKSAELQYSSLKAERLPSLSGFANYGSSGNMINNNVPTWAIGLSLNLPIYDGGAVDARRAEKNSKYRQEQIKTNDLSKQVELEVRLAFESTRVAKEQIVVAEKQVQLVNEELEQARRRYRAGITTSLELSDAQTRLQQAEEVRIQAIRGFYFSRIGLLNAVGILRTSKIM